MNADYAELKNIVKLVNPVYPFLAKRISKPNLNPLQLARPRSRAIFPRNRSCVLDWANGVSARL